jgi:hypothetical protein
VVDQPLSQCSGEFLLWDYPLYFWLEKARLRRNLSLEYRYAPGPGEALAGEVFFLSVGHDEYGSLQRFETVRDAVEDGLSAAFLSGNSVKWMIAIASETRYSRGEVDLRMGLLRDGTRIPAL